MRRGKSDSSSSTDKRSQELHDNLKRRNLIFSKLRSDRQKYFNNEKKSPKKDLTTVPLVISGCHDEDVSTQSSGSDKFSADMNKRTCFTSMIGVKHKELPLQTCIGSMVGSKPREIDNFPTEIVGSYEARTKVKINEPKESSKVKITVPLQKNQVKTPKGKARLSVKVPSEPFDGKGIPGSIITTTDDENSVVVSTENLYFAHFSVFDVFENLYSHLYWVSHFDYSLFRATKVPFQSQLIN